MPILNCFIGQVHKGLPLINVRFHERATTESYIILVQTVKPEFNKQTVKHHFNEQTMNTGSNGKLLNFRSIFMSEQQLSRISY